MRSLFLLLMTSITALRLTCSELINDLLLRLPGGERAVGLRERRGRSREGNWVGEMSAEDKKVPRCARRVVADGKSSLTGRRGELKCEETDSSV